MQRGANLTDLTVRIDSKIHGRVIDNVILNNDFIRQWTKKC
jgi:hypothetical protein